MRKSYLFKSNHATNKKNYWLTITCWDCTLETKIQHKAISANWMQLGIYRKCNWRIHLNSEAYYYPAGHSMYLYTIPCTPLRTYSKHHLSIWIMRDKELLEINKLLSLINLMTITLICVYRMMCFTLLVSNKFSVRI